MAITESIWTNWMKFYQHNRSYSIQFLILYLQERLLKVDKDAVIIDLASAPGGVDYIAAQELGIKAYLELSLPGIVAPKTAGKIVYQVINNLVEKARNCGIIRR